MGFFKTMFGGAGDEPPDNTSRNYLGATPNGPTGRPMDRKGSLYMAALNRIERLPVAGADAFGRPLADTFELGEATSVVRELMRQDRSLHAWVARNGLVLLDVVLENMPGSWDDNLEGAMGAAGIDAGPRLAERWRAELPPGVGERAEGLSNCVLQMFWVVAQPQFNRGADRSYYDHVFTSNTDSNRETAFDITAWTAVVIGRLTAKGKVPRLPFYDPALLTPPAMTTPGWYPNPFNFGDIVNGDATYQRYWDGDDWTSRIRQRNGRSWNESTHSLYSAPDN